MLFNMDTQKKGMENAFNFFNTKKNGTFRVAFYTVLSEDKCNKFQFIKKTKQPLLVALRVLFWTPETSGISERSVLPRRKLPGSIPQSPKRRMLTCVSLWNTMLSVNYV